MFKISSEYINKACSGIIPAAIFSTEILLLLNF